MGTGIYGGFGDGTKGAQENDALQAESLISELEKNGTKFSKEDILFITRDTTGQIIWMESGNSNAGMQHIIARHSQDFLEKHGIDEANLQQHLKVVFQKGTVEYSRVTRSNGGYERLYSHDGKHYLLSGIGSNGYIVSAYPIDSNDAIKLIRRYRK